MSGCEKTTSPVTPDLYSQIGRGTHSAHCADRRTRVNLSTSPLVTPAAQARRRPNLVVVWIVALVAIFAGQIGGAQIAEAITGHGSDGTVASQWNEVITNGFTLLVLALWVIFYERRSFWSLGLRDRRVVARFAAGVLGGIALVAIPIVILAVLGQFTTDATDSHTTTGTAAVWIVVSLIPVWIVQGSTEEIVVRGYLLQWHGLQLKNGWVAVLLPSIGFAVVHLDFHPIVLINIILIALFFSFLSLAQGSIWLAAGIHAGWNMAQSNIFGAPVSGSTRDVALFTFGADNGSSDVLTGGDFGVEGSIVTTVVILIAAYGSYLYYRRSSRHHSTSPSPGSAPTPITDR